MHPCHKQTPLAQLETWSNRLRCLQESLPQWKKRDSEHNLASKSILRPPINTGPDPGARVKETRWYHDNLSVTLHHAQKETRRVQTDALRLDRHVAIKTDIVWPTVFIELSCIFTAKNCMQSSQYIKHYTYKKNSTDRQTGYWADRGLIWRQIKPSSKWDVLHW